MLELDSETNHSSLGPSLGSLRFPILPYSPLIIRKHRGFRVNRLHLRHKKSGFSGQLAFRHKFGAKPKFISRSEAKCQSKIYAKFIQYIFGTKKRQSPPIKIIYRLQQKSNSHQLKSNSDSCTSRKVNFYLTWVNALVVQHQITIYDDDWHYWSSKSIHHGLIPHWRITTVTSLTLKRK